MNFPYDRQPLDKKQARVKGRDVLRPMINLNDYRFEAVLDWIKIRVSFTRTTQVQHVQKALRKYLNRDSWIVGLDMGSGETFSECVITIQEPKNFALVQQIADDLAAKFGEASPACVVGLEVSVDAYPKMPSEAARVALLREMLRTAKPNFDFWTDPNAHPRTITAGKSVDGVRGKATVSHINPTLRRAGNFTGEFSHDVYIGGWGSLSVDGTSYFGPKDGDLMVRLMHKIIDTQNHKSGTWCDLPEEEKRVRIEVTLNEAELNRRGFSTIQSLKDFKPTVLQKEVFKFWLPTFPKPVPEEKKTENRKAIEKWQGKRLGREQVFQSAGMVGLGAMDQALAASKKMIVQGIPVGMRNAKMQARVGDTHVAWDELNGCMNEALRNLGKRMGTAWGKL
ncbi:hypothetical protein [Ketogulonicigenium vulgare]|uniref:hypothetical protein n=1 Tax=Ketogulonicigenium vulgare TaxID=92945 RepID=UPI00235872CB|nr:hypothetical protein [Ketogulonicigenium vulgare]